MLKGKISTSDIKNIFGNRANKRLYLTKLFELDNISYRISNDNNEIDQLIIDTWDYKKSKSIIREIFRNHPKYIKQRYLDKEIDKALSDWKDLNLGELEWPFSAMAFDQHVHLLNRNDDYSEKEKDDILAKEVIKFRRIKHINALRNDYIEYLIFQNENIIPTLGNRKSVDFYINGKPFDQKVGKSTGKAFIEKYGDEYRKVAIEHPDLLAISLYENQDEERFGDEPRLLIVYLDSDVPSHKIKEQLSKVDFYKPLEITFDYKHSDNVIMKHSTECYVVLLHK